MGSHGPGKLCATCLDKKGGCKCPKWTYEDFLENVKKISTSSAKKLVEEAKKAEAEEPNLMFSLQEASFLLSTIEMFMDATIVRKMMPDGLWEMLLDMASKGMDNVESKMIIVGPGGPGGEDGALEEILSSGGWESTEDPAKKAARTGKAVIGNPWDALKTGRKGD